MLNFSKKDCMLLEYLYKEELNTPFLSLRTDQIAEIIDAKSSKTYQTIKAFTLAGLIAEGSKDEYTKTYYITKAGERYYEEIMGIEN